MSAIWVSFCHIFTYIGLFPHVVSQVSSVMCGCAVVRVWVHLCVYVCVCARLESFPLFLYPTWWPQVSSVMCVCVGVCACVYVCVRLKTENVGQFDRSLF